MRSEELQPVKLLGQNHRAGIICYSPDGYMLKPGLSHDIWTPRNMYQRWLRLGILKRYILLHILLCETIVGGGERKSVSFSATCPLLYFLISLFRAALVLCLCFCFSAFFFIFFAFLLGLCGSVSLARLCASVLLHESPTVYHSPAFFFPSLFLNVPLIPGFCFKNDMDPFSYFSKYPQVLRAPQVCSM